MNMAVRLRRIVEHRKVLWTLVKRDLRVRYARSVLGYLWTLIDPLAMALVYWFVFGVIYKTRSELSSDGAPFVLFLVAGLLPWNWFNMSINESARALYAERLLVRSTNLPRELWVIRLVIAKGIEFVMSLPILIGFMLYFRFGTDQIYIHPEKFLYWIPALVLEFLLCVGLGFVMAPVTALVDDFVRLVRIGLRVLFYLTPIVYSTQILSDRAPWARHIQQFNPLTGINDMFRQVFLTHVTPDYHAWIFAAVVTVFWLFVGMWVFKKLEPAVLKEI
ncbi:ABC transporter permease [Flexivirga sp. ID2601S]|uniref:Transport permease protein n=1 Tax=Flexivirga aerilata TaxID=1656889 RepID=A0A849AIA4_9MICO|nr:ABC transporter permease [Flexivirga aerilata]NNG40175.1 ABC transporter permease [Flexivirga aerilata]